MTFYGDDFRNMLGLEKANDLGDLTIMFEKDELHPTREYHHKGFRFISRIKGKI